MIEPVTSYYSLIFSKLILPFVINRIQKWINKKFKKDVYDDTLIELMAECVGDAKRKFIHLKAKRIKSFLNTEKNYSEIIYWISEDVTEEDFDITKFDLLYVDTITQLEEFLKFLLSLIIKRKLTKFTVGDLNNRSLILKGNNQFRKLLTQRAPKATPTIPDKPRLDMKIESRDWLSEEYGKLRNQDEQAIISEIKSLIDDGLILSARKKALHELCRTKSNDIPSSDNFKFFLNAYTAETYIRDHGKEEKAIKYLNISSEYSPILFKKFRNKSYAKYLEGDTIKARELIEKAYNEVPNDWTVMSLKIMIIQREDGPQEALKAILLVEDKFEDNFDYLYQCGMLFYQLSKYEECLKYLNRSVDINETPWARNQIGMALLKQLYEFSK